ncbi:MAG: hypothetical protein QF486_04060 [Candidatus Woesearchaeota archaeon]|nr:hypothetical protein [Candidatus Woesearchaeota archaeon]MDP7181680.1 hypothetical protein [Candidatus Woesearchaeota archaeon]MDP7198769.1 hypothetical protein [Candidatus Woesearchaeota archaeon]MDP7467231.1 hypothetical protein [Candidatus Woesearchaeota archaeon]MDP7647434.1 hypothetical protein [Candidatus Woesearchaeota archaeon]
MNCAICKATIEQTFLNKIIGTYVKKDSKRHVVCFACQKKLPHKELVEKL